MASNTPSRWERIRAYMSGRDPYEYDDEVEALRNAAEQALLLLERERYCNDPEAKVVRAVLWSALR